VSDVIRIAVILAIVAYVIGRQLLGEPLRGKRVVLLPAVLAVIGIADLHGSRLPLKADDVACLVIGGILAAGIGIGQGWLLRLESRNGALWGQMPARGLWLWLLLVVTRGAVTVVAHGLDARLAASSATILLMLGINRMAQAAVVLPRAISAGIPFAPEKDGSAFLSTLTAHDAGSASGSRIDWHLVAAQMGRLVDEHRESSERVH
jgi:hypothetical protein